MQFLRAVGCWLGYCLLFGATCLWGQSIWVSGRLGSLTSAYDALGNTVEIGGGVRRWEGVIGGILPLQNGWFIQALLAGGGERFTNTTNLQKIYGLRKSSLGGGWERKPHQWVFIFHQDLAQNRKTFFPQPGESLTDDQTACEWSYHFSKRMGRHTKSTAIHLTGHASYFYTFPLTIEARSRFTYDGGDRLILGMGIVGQKGPWRGSFALRQHGVYFMRIDGEKIQDFSLLTDILAELTYQPKETPLSLLVNNALPADMGVQGWGIAGIRQMRGRGISFGIRWHFVPTMD
ncbi:MAG: hypothetical protein JNN12_02545 [Bacteroidetes Order II. Incertae sedis bacterium]|nr:hypothetical protein [Bacteroidetes Order II. bacterium]